MRLTFVLVMWDRKKKVTEQVVLQTMDAINAKLLSVENIIEIDIFKMYMNVDDHGCVINAGLHFIKNRISVSLL